MTGCARHAPMLSAREGELAPAERAALDAHLERCEACRARLADERALSGILGEALLEAAARRDFAGFADGVMARIEGRRAGGLRSLWRRHRRGMALAAGLVPALASLGLVVYLERDRIWGAEPQAGEVEVASEGADPIVLSTSDGPLVLLGDSGEAGGT